MKKTIILLAAFLMTASSLLALEPDKVLSQIASRNASTNTLEFVFNQTRTLPNKNKVEMTGTCYYTKGDKLSMKYTKPAGEYFTINGSKVKMLRNGKEQAFDLTKAASVKTLSDCLLNAFAGKVNELATSAKMYYDVDETSNEYVVTLIAQEKLAKGYSKIIIKYAKSNLVVSSVQMEEVNHTVNLYTRKDIKLNKPIDAAVYSVK